MLRSGCEKLEEGLQLVFFEEGIQQRNQDCEKDKKKKLLEARSTWEKQNMCGRNKVYVEEQMGKLKMSCMKYRWLRLLLWC